MTSYIALLRGVNIGGRLLKMVDLKRIADGLGFGSPRTFIASGNLLFSSDREAAALKRLLESALEAHFGKPVAVMIRTAAELEAAALAKPFDEEPGNKVAAIFFDDPPDAEAIRSATNLADERLALGKREIYVHYPGGMGSSKLKLGTKALGTARNMNTVAKLADLAREQA